ncbi:hypothetical protein JG687_00006458 [Phytophthora cactorum]|uniref:Uncharacterized protein n=1 Tax=Phytophthora cactorum TaxID=29920 RepID=A0A8T1UMV5_9STRA|nr:hypothetical protein JG687_00006458 [Phytophthora cactorum]
MAPSSDEHVQTLEVAADKDNGRGYLIWWLQATSPSFLHAVTFLFTAFPVNLLGRPSARAT